MNMSEPFKKRPTEQQLIEALRKADATGDTFAANRFAELIKEQRSQKPVTKTPVSDTRSNILGGALNQFLDGSMFGFSDELAGVGHAVRSLGNDKSFSENYRAGRDQIRGFNNDFSQEHPEVAIPATMAGGLLTGGAGAVRSGATQSLPRLAAYGTATGATAGLGSSEAETTQGLLTDTGTGAIVGGLLGTGIPVVGRKVSDKLLQRKTDKVLSKVAPSTEQLKDASSSIYKSIDDSGAKLGEEFTGSLFGKLTKELNKEALPETQPPAIKKVLRALKNREGKAIKFSEFDAIRKVANSLSKSSDDNERRLGGIIKDRMDNAFEKATDGPVSAQFKNARQLWSRAKKAEIIEEAIRVSGNAASGDENGLRKAFRSISSNKKLFRQFTKEEQQLIDGVHKGNWRSNLAKLIGKFGAFEGQNPRSLMPLIGIGVGGHVGGGFGALAAPMVGQAARNTAGKMTRNQANKTLNTVLAGPNARQIVAGSLNRPQDEIQGLLLDPVKSDEILSGLLAEPQPYSPVLSGVGPVSGLLAN